MMSMIDIGVVSLIIITLLALAGAIEPWLTEWIRSKNQVALLVGVLPPAYIMMIALIRLFTIMLSLEKTTPVDVAVWIIGLFLSITLFIVPRYDFSPGETEEVSLPIEE